MATRITEMEKRLLLENNDAAQIAQLQNLITRLQSQLTNYQNQLVTHQTAQRALEVNILQAHNVNTVPEDLISIRKNQDGSVDLIVN